MSKKMGKASCFPVDSSSRAVAPWQGPIQEQATASFQDLYRSCCRYVVGLLVLVAVVVWLWRFLTEGGAHEPPPLGLQPNVWLPYGASETIGARNYMEDRHVAASQLMGREDSTLYAVFDGHGGSRAAEFCRQHMAANLTASAAYPADPARALADAFHQTDHDFLHAALGATQPWNDGTTAVAALVRGSRLWVANAGDSRAVIVGSWGARALSEDHKPDRPDERRRIVQRGGTVMKVGVWRVEGMLAVSRAIGDRLLKRYVPPTPEVAVLDLAEGDSWLVLATDGLWDVVESRELAGMLRGVECPVQAARKLVFVALSRRSLDNVTVLVVDLRGAVGKAEAVRAREGGGKGGEDAVAARPGELAAPGEGEALLDGGSGGQQADVGSSPRGAQGEMEEEGEARRRASAPSTLMGAGELDGAVVAAALAHGDGMLESGAGVVEGLPAGAKGRAGEASGVLEAAPAGGEDAGVLRERRAARAGSGSGAGASSGAVSEHVDELQRGRGDDEEGDGGGRGQSGRGVGGGGRGVVRGRAGARGGSQQSVGAGSEAGSGGKGGGGSRKQ